MKAASLPLKKGKLEIDVKEPGCLDALAPRLL